MEEKPRKFPKTVWPLSKICAAENRFNAVSVGKIKAVVTRAGSEQHLPCLANHFLGLTGTGANPQPCWDGDRDGGRDGGRDPCKAPAEPGKLEQGWSDAKPNNSMLM